MLEVTVKVPSTSDGPWVLIIPYCNKTEPKTKMHTYLWILDCPVVLLLLPAD